MASPEYRRERDRNERRHVDMRDVVDVVVLGHDEALAIPRGVYVDLSVKLQDHRALVERRAAVAVRHVDQRGLPVRGGMDEAALVGPGGHVGDHVELLARFGERTLHRAVVVRRHDELMTDPATSQEGGDLGQQTVNRARCEVGVQGSRSSS